MELGTQIRFNDGRKATVVYNSLIGVGCIWGLHDPNPEDFINTDGNAVTDGAPDDWPWEPEILLRCPWTNNAEFGFNDNQCIDEPFEIIRYGLHPSEGAFYQ